MAKKPAKKVIVSDLVPDSIFKLPADFNTDHVKVTKISDLANDNSLGAAVTGKNSLVSVTAISGPFKGMAASVILNSNDEVTLLKAPKKKVFGYEMWGAASVFAILAFALVYSDSLVKFIG